MKRLLHFCLPFLVFFILPSFAFEGNQAKAPFEGIKRVKVLVSQSYGDVKGVNLPFYDVALRFLNWAGISVVGEEAEDYDAVLQVEANGSPIKGYYDEMGHLVFTPFPLEEYWEKKRAERPFIEEEEEYEEYESFPPDIFYPTYRPYTRFSSTVEGEKVKDILYTGATLKGSIKLIRRGGETLSEEFEGAQPPDDWLERYAPYHNELAMEPEDAPFLDTFLDDGSFVDKLALLVAKAFGIKSLIFALGDDDWKVVRAAERTLEKFGSSAIEFLASALDDPLTSVRTSAVEILGNLKNPLCFDYLLKALDDPSPTVRLLAARGLGKLRDKRAVEPLMKALEDGSADVRKGAISALGELKEQKVVDKLIKIARDPLEDKEVREVAILALGRIGGEEAFNELLDIAQTKIVDPQLRYSIKLSALKALGYTRDPRAIDVLVKAWLEEEFSPTCLDSLVKIGPPAVDSLLAIFNDKDYSPYRRSEVARALGKIKDKRAVESLVASLDEEDFSLLENVKWALYKIGEPSVPALLNALKNPKMNVRLEAIKVLGYLKANPALEPIISIANNKDEPLQLRQAAIEALRRFDEPRSFKVLLSLITDREEDERIRTNALYALDFSKYPIPEELFSLLQDKKENVGMRGAIAEVLSTTGDSRVFNVLLKITNDKEEPINFRIKCARILGRINGEKGGEILLSFAQSNPELTEACALALAELGDIRALPLLISLLEKTSRFQDSTLINALKSYKKPEALPYFLKLCQSDDQRMRQLGAELLGNIPTQSSLDTLLSLLKDEYPAVRRASALSLGKLGSFQAIEPLLEALKDDYAIVREASTTALGDIGDKRAVEYLLPLLKEPNKSVRESAIIALGKLRDPRALPPLLDMFKRFFTSDYHTYDYKHDIPLAVYRAIVRIGKPAVEPLIGILRDESAISYLREMSAVLLGEIKDSRAVEPLLSTLEESMLSIGRRDKPVVSPTIIVRALRNITYQDFGDDFLLWQEWWSNNKSLFLKGGK